MYEVSHFMIDAKANGANCNVPSKKRRSGHQIEDDAPTRHLRMMIATRMILPVIVEAIASACRR
jgi:hypothetical protein